jgi:hypothetical protein
MSMRMEPAPLSGVAHAKGAGSLDLLAFLWAGDAEGIDSPKGSGPPARPIKATCRCGTSAPNILLDGIGVRGQIFAFSTINVRTSPPSGRKDSFLCRKRGRYDFQEFT